MITWVCHSRSIMMTRQLDHSRVMHNAGTTISPALFEDLSARYLCPGRSRHEASAIGLALDARYFRRSGRQSLSATHDYGAADRCWRVMACGGGVAQAARAAAVISARHHFLEM